MEYTFPQIVVGTYLAVGFAKFMLALPHVRMVVGVMSRLSGATRGTVRTRYVLLVPVLLATMSFFGWIPALVKEGWGFFVIYPSRAVIRDCVKAYRTMHEE